MKGMKDMEAPAGEQDVLDRLRELADASKGRQAPADLEARLLRAFAEARQTRSVRMRWAPAVAASAVLATAVALLILQTRGLPRRDAVPARDVAATAPNPLNGFVPIPGAAALPSLESASIVRYELPVSALPRYGVDVMPDAAQRAVEADLLIGQDGYARAIRLLTGSMP